jgi:predicted phage baseplate assembly protein
VDGVRWKEVPSLYGLAPDDRAYIVRHQDDGKTYVQFARPLPTGTDNVVAFYRKGIGTVAMVKAGQLSLLAIRPLGVRSVVNPLAASGAQDREDSESIRSNAPLTVLTMGRLVSLTDYQDFARSFAGFSKALATPTLDGGRQGIFVTVAGATVTPPLETDQSFTNLASSMKDLGDPFVQFQLKPYTLIYFQIEAGISIDANYQEPAVIAAVQDLLRTAYSFENRGLGQSVSAAEVTALIQSVPGVIYVDLDKLFRTGDTAGWNASLTPPAPVPGDSSASAVPAGLLVLDPRPTAITPITEVAQ